MRDRRVLGKSLDRFQSMAAEAGKVIPLNCSLLEQTAALAFDSTCRRCKIERYWGAAGNGAETGCAAHARNPVLVCQGVEVLFERPQPEWV